MTRFQTRTSKRTRARRFESLETRFALDGCVGSGSFNIKVWHDVNRDGVYYFDESAVNGIELTLYDATGASVGTALSGSDNGPEFENLCPGNYSVGVTVPAGVSI